MRRITQTLLIPVWIFLTAGGIYVISHKISQSLPKDLYASPHPPYVAVTANGKTTTASRLELLLKTAESQFISVWRYGV